MRKRKDYKSTETKKKSRYSATCDARQATRKQSKEKKA